MRIVQFTPPPGNAITYPAEGVSAFGRTMLINGVVVGEYNGAATADTLPSYNGTWPPTRTEYKTALSPGAVLVLLGATAYAALYAAAYPKDATPADPQALFFLESAKNPYSEDGLLLVDRAPVTDAMAYFVSVGYISPGDAARVIAGQPYEVPL